MKKILLPVLALATGATTYAAEPTSVADAVQQGKVSLNARLRYEHVDQTGLRDADAITLRTRLGFTTARYAGWQAMIEGENVLPFDGSTYSQAGLNASGRGRAVVADPAVTEINQLWVSFAHEKTTGTFGRQRLVLDNARFIGDVGWRQNQQTYDAFVLQDKSLGKTTLTYAYLDQINRVFSHRHPQGKWESNSHLAHVNYTGLSAGAISAYAYLLEFDNARTNSSATYGASFSGARPLNDAVKLGYRLEAAAQSDYGNNAQNYSTSYWLLEAGPVWKSFGFSLGHERLGSDNNVGFKTPLATLHAHNGWADLFLATPASGLSDTYVKANATLPQAVSLLAFYHWFESDRGSVDFGQELDVQLSRKFGKNLTATAKFADFQSDTTALPDVRKYWLQLEYVY
jgi:hypothetical protein